MVCQGFRAAGLACGIKKNGNPDLGLIVSDGLCQAAGVFTRNLVQAAPVKVCRRHLETGTGQAIIVNSGNANCCTGKQGEQDALRMCSAAASELGMEPGRILVASTGVIGEPLPVDRIAGAMPGLVKSLAPDGFRDLARAIMTTDTRPKIGWRRGRIEGRPFSVVAVAKGAGMIRPDMATMLCFACTDAEIDSALLQQVLLTVVNRTFNRITIDGDTSTNDSVLVMANGFSGARVDDQSRAIFQDLLTDLFADLAMELVKDGEGATKVVRVEVVGAANDEDARMIADTVANSPLVKTAFFGQDANWGRIIGAAGRSGAGFDPDRVDIFFDRVKMVNQGVGCGQDAEEKATAVLHQPEFTVKLDFNQGSGHWSILTCDLSVDYVKINADYRS